MKNPIRPLMGGLLLLALLAFTLNLGGKNLAGGPVQKMASPLDDNKVTVAPDAPTAQIRQGAVSSSNSEVSRVGTSILESGGNAVDAAVAMAYAIGVVEPYSSGPGGGGGALIALPDGEGEVFVDFREIADGRATKRTDRFGIPGFFLGMEYLNETYGVADHKELIAPAIQLAEDGILITPELSSLLRLLQDRLDRSSVFFQDGLLVEMGTVLPLPDAAETLRGIAEFGAEFFYTEILTQAVPDLSFDMESLRKYLVVEREPIEKTFDGHRVVSAPAPFSGSSLIQYVHLAVQEDLPVVSKADGGELVTYSRIANLMLDQRASTLGDPRYGGADVDLDVSLDEPPAMALGVGDWREEHVSTAHLSVVDRDGLAVSMTLSLGNYFGNGKTIGGFLGNEVLAFSSAGVNVIEPYRKVRSFMAPTIVIDEDSVLVAGTPGGNKIPQILGQTLLNFWESGDLEDATETPRIVSQGPQVYMELYRDAETEQWLRRASLGVSYEEHDTFYGAVNTVNRSKNGDVQGYADQRRQGSYEVVSAEDAS